MRCQDEACTADQLVLPGFLDEPVTTRMKAEVEPEGEPRVVPPEGGETETSQTKVYSPEGPPLGFLEQLWEGQYDGKTTGA